MPYKVYSTRHIVEVIEYKYIRKKGGQGLAVGDERREYPAADAKDTDYIKLNIGKVVDQQGNEYEIIIDDCPMIEEYKEEVKQYNKEYYRRKQKIQLRRDIVENFDNKAYFSTMTFAENITEIQEGHKYINKFITNLRQKDKQLKYICIPEYTKAGRVHYHSIIQSEVYKKKELDSKWLYGQAMVKNIREVDNLGAYITKYITKDIEEMEGRIILKSRNLVSVEPEIYSYNPFEAHKITYTKSWADYWGNTVTYLQYNLRRQYL